VRALAFSNNIRSPVADTPDEAMMAGLVKACRSSRVTIWMSLRKSTKIALDSPSVGISSASGSEVVNRVVEANVLAMNSSWPRNLEAASAEFVLLGRLSAVLETMVLAASRWTCQTGESEAVRIKFHFVRSGPKLTRPKSLDVCKDKHSCQSCV
jgi:hypothetical protein